MASLSYDDILTCCASAQFAKVLARSGPFSNSEELITKARSIWWHEVGVQGWLQAFAAHPRIGDVAGLKAKYGAFAAHSNAEQSAALGDDSCVYQELADWNQQYEVKFGHIFIVCASGKTAGEMLAILKGRYPNTPHQELAIAAAEQMKITEIRMLKALQGPSAPGASPADKASRRTGQLLAHLTEAPARPPGRSPITTHVLDATLGIPAKGLPITLYKQAPGSNSVWEPMASGSTNDDGRISDLLPANSLEPGTYKMWFDTGVYLRACHAAHPQLFAAEPFYPEASVEFCITAAMVKQHFHIPLLLAPYSYSTYRGS